MAKSSYVWLEQLARSFQRPITTLADVPDEELDRLAGLGVTGLWLIGLWQRSRASAEIKRRRGDAEAVASAYAIDSSWVVEHPDRFTSLPEPPYPAYSFSGPDLSQDDRVEITLEDHYWDNT